MSESVEQSRQPKAPQSNNNDPTDRRLKALSNSDNHHQTGSQHCQRGKGHSAIEFHRCSVDDSGELLNWLSFESSSHRISWVRRSSFLSSSRSGEGTDVVFLLFLSEVLKCFNLFEKTYFCVAFRDVHSEFVLLCSLCIPHIEIHPGIAAHNNKSQNSLNNRTTKQRP